jgi:hypothetical protein
MCETHGACKRQQTEELTWYEVHPYEVVHFFFCAAR